VLKALFYAPGEPGREVEVENAEQAAVAMIGPEAESRVVGRERRFTVFSDPGAEKDGNMTIEDEEFDGPILVFALGPDEQPAGLTQEDLDRIG